METIASFATDKWGIRVTKEESLEEIKGWVARLGLSQPPPEEINEGDALLLDVSITNKKTGESNSFGFVDWFMGGGNPDYFIYLDERRSQLVVSGSKNFYVVSLLDGKLHSKHVNYLGILDDVVLLDNDHALTFSHLWVVCYGPDWKDKWAVSEDIVSDWKIEGDTVIVDWMDMGKWRYSIETGERVRRK